MQREGPAVRSRHDVSNAVLFRAVAGGYLETMGIRADARPTIYAGRRRAEGASRRRETMRSRSAYFPSEDPIGQYVISSAPPPTPGGPPVPAPLQIVGVVGNTPIRSLAEPMPASQLYMPMSIAGGPDIPAQALVGPDVSR